MMFAFSVLILGLAYGLPRTVFATDAASGTAPTDAGSAVRHDPGPVAPVRSLAGQAAPIALLIGAVIGGIYTGIFTSIAASFPSALGSMVPPVASSGSLPS